MRFVITRYAEHRGRDASEQLVVKSCRSPVEGGENSSSRAYICFEHERQIHAASRAKFCASLKLFKLAVQPIKLVVIAQWLSLLLEL